MQPRSRAVKSRGCALVKRRDGTGMRLSTSAARVAQRHRSAARQAQRHRAHVHARPALLHSRHGGTARSCGRNPLPYKPSCRTPPRGSPCSVRALAGGRCRAQECVQKRMGCAGKGEAVGHALDGRSGGSSSGGVCLAARPRSRPKPARGGSAVCRPARSDNVCLGHRRRARGRGTATRGAQQRPAARSLCDCGAWASGGGETRCAQCGADGL